MPIVAAVVIGLVIGSAFVLVFALLSPVIAIATMIDGRRAARRHVVDERRRFDQECIAYLAAVDAAHAEEARADDPAPASWVRIGTGPRVSAVAPEAPLIVGDSEPERRLASLLARARVNPARALLVPRGDIVVRGRTRAAETMAARLALEAGVTVTRAPGEPSVPAVSTVTVHSALRVEVVSSDGARLNGRPDLPSALELSARAARQEQRSGSLPTAIAWREVTTVPGHGGARGADEHATGLHATGVRIGRGTDGDAVIDLVADGPHALVGGTTGSGKSEFLRTLALGWAAQQSPRHLQLLFVDFKGGSTFAGLLDLPHAIGLITDLDPLIAERTLLGLRAELRRRERLLVEHGLRDAADAPETIPRLVVLVDEFAALIDTFPELQAPFADISARGRSLGVHLVLGTQHPAAAVRDAVAANCALRVAFRLAGAAGAAFVGPSGRELSSAPPGRALIVVGDTERAVQVAVIDDADIAAVAERWGHHPGGPQPWQPPLPARVTAPELERQRAENGPAAPARDEHAIPFGLLDDPAELRRDVAHWNPHADGALAIIGCPGSGRTSTLAALAEAAAAQGRAVHILPGAVPAAWERLESIAAAAAAAAAAAPAGPAPHVQPRRGAVLLADDLDHLVADAAERGPELLALWEAAARALRAAGGGVAAAVGPATASRTIVGARFPVRLLLRALDANDHALAGAPRGLFDRAAPPGRGWWLDRQAQVVEPRGVLPVASVAATVWRPPRDRDTVVVAASREGAIAALGAAHPHRTIIDGAPATSPALSSDEGGGRLIIADVEQWQAAWAVLTELRRRCPVLAIGIAPGELRSLLGVRAAPPPIAADRGECWLVEPGGGAPRRVGLPSVGGA